MHTPHRFWKIVALTVLIMGFLGILRLYWGAVHWKNELPLEGLIALYAGVIAFVAIMIQLEEERNAHVAEQERQRRALATAILFEINSFYCDYVGGLQAVLRDMDVEGCKLLGMRMIPADTFPIYRGNAINIGLLEAALVGSLVGFYSDADAYLCALRDYRVESDRYYHQGADPVAEEKARTFLRKIKSAGPEVTKTVQLLCQQLCMIASVQFRAPTVAVAAEEGLTTKEITPSLEGADAQTH